MSDRLVRALLFSATAVASTGSVTSSSLDLRYVNRVEAIVLKATSVLGAADVKIEYQSSHDDVDYESADDTTDIVASTATANTGAPEGYNAYDVPAILNRYMKIKVTGVESNPADTLVTGYAILREIDQT